MTWLRSLLAVLAMMLAVQAEAQQRDAFNIVGTLAPEQFHSLLEQIAVQAPFLDPSYTQMRENDIVSAVESSVAPENPIDLAILPTPDMGVRLANEGYLSALQIAPAQPDPSHWRQEVFSLFYDPSVVLVRNAAFEQTAIIKNRRNLVRFLESRPDWLRKRVGLVNIGIDNQSFAYAAQDQLRSPLFWRITQAFGDLEARIYETNAEILEALRSGQIDLAYNMPLSQLTFGPQQGIQVVVPDDYVVALPWVVVAPASSKNRSAATVVKILRMEIFKRRFPGPAFWKVGHRNGILQAQHVKIGPELLVFQDPLKKTSILDIWFQTVTGQ